MGKLLERAKAKSPFIRLEIGGKTEPMIYRGWKEITNSFGSESFRYMFDVTGENGIMQKSFDNPTLGFSAQMDVIPFGSKVVISRHQKLDKQGEPLENKSYYTAESIE